MKIAIIDLLGLTYDGSTLEKRGLGGSESAVILISKELAKLGFEVTVYNNCIDSEAAPGVYNGVEYVDHSQHLIDSRHKNYDVVISSRSVFPFMANNQYARLTMSAKYRVLWMHDTFCQGDENIEPMLTSNFIHEVYTLSDFHTSYVLNNDHGGIRRMFDVIKHRAWLTRNGAVKWIDEVDVKKKDPDHFVYNASATKGLMPLLQDVWPEVKRQIPSAKLTCIGGYYRFREGAEPDAQEKTVRALMEDTELTDLDVTFTGVIPQSEIAKILANATFMIYPPAFPETFGISSLESLLYKTPIITGNFGALSETAIANACYKIDYPVEPNSLYPHINKKEQVKKFVELVVSAYKEPYILQQKQNACDLVRNIYSWETVALQWKQHIYGIFSKHLSVDDYRKVSRINDEVRRVFNRRFSNFEDRKRYSSYGKQNRIAVISPFWNAESYVKENILSIAQQDYDNYVHILIDDASTDNSYNIAKTTIDNLPSSIKDKFKLIKNKENKGCIFNQLAALKKYTLSDDIVMLLDGDDWLINNNTIFHYYNDLYNQGYEFTYGSMKSLADKIDLIAQDYPEDVKQNKQFRNHHFNWIVPYTHLRTFKQRLIEDINVNSLKEPETGNWMKAGADTPLFYELIEQVDPKKIYCVKEVMMIYNDKNPLNDYKIHGEEQNRNAKTAISYEIKNNKNADIIEQIEKNQMNQTKNKRILIAVPTNKYIETETFKSIYDLTIPEGYETEFQFFYGYQIDQIRNLIAEWAKHYDYLFSVDSDIVLPKDTLVKMIAADKDIISGLYIQRIPGTHTLEVYKDYQGGCVNIPYEEIEDKKLVEIAACGMGCALIKGNVFRKLEYPHFYYRSAIDHRNTISEDVFFCKKARDNGFKIWADTTIKCDHIGSTKFQVMQTKPKSHLERIAEQDLLPKAHADYLKSMTANPKVVYDIGACVLHWTRKAKEAWPSAEYYLIDAATSVTKFLQNSEHACAIELLSNKDNEEIIFYEDTENPGGNSYYLETTGAFTEQHATVRKTKTLDTLVKERNWPLPDLIKLDVQGAEIDILLGASKTLKNCKDVILEAQHVDYNQGAPKVDRVIKFMEYLGFRLVSNFCKGDADGDYHFTRA